MMTLRQARGRQGFRDGPDLIARDEDRVGDIVADAPGHDPGVGTETITTCQLYRGAERRVQMSPTIPVVLGKPILPQHRRAVPDHLLVVGDHVRVRKRPPLRAQAACAPLETPRRGGIDSDSAALARGETGTG